MPTDAQIKAGNYPKKHIRVAGLPISVENRKGSLRSGTSRDGEKWSVLMPCDYGYFKRTVGADGDQVDCFVGPNKDSEFVVIVNQHDAIGGTFDEHKVMLGFNTLAQAKATYRASYRGRFVPRAVFKPTTLERFKEWLASRRTWGAFQFGARINLIQMARRLTEPSVNVKPTEFRQPEKREEKRSTAARVARVVAPLAITGTALYLWHNSRPKNPTPAVTPEKIVPAPKPAPAKKSAATVKVNIAQPVKRKLVTNRLAALHARLVLFNDQDPFRNNQYGAAAGVLTAYRKGRRLVPVLRRGTQVAEDTADIASGRKVKDPFYKKAWFKSAAIGAAIAAPVVAARKINKYHNQEKNFPGSVTGLRKKILDAARRNVPRLTENRPFFAARAVAIHLEQKRPLSTSQATRDEVMKRLLAKMSSFNKKPANFTPRPGRNLSCFDFDAETRGWDVRDPRGRSARVFAPGSRRRERREKSNLEKVSTIRAVRNAALVAAAGGIGGALYYRNRLKNATAKTPRLTKPGTGKVVAVNFARKDDATLHRIVGAAHDNVSLPGRPEVPGEGIARVVVENKKSRSAVLRILGAGTVAGGATLIGMAKRRPKTGAAIGGLGAGLILAR